MQRFTRTATFAAIATAATAALASPPVSYNTTTIDGLDIFYREAGPKEAPAVLLLHGFPTSSQMFRDLIPELAEEYRVIAPDYPGYGNSSAPSHTEYDYTFENFTNVVEELTEQLGLETYTLYVMDYGAPVGYRLFERDPEAVDAFIIQNGNAYVEGLQDFWNPIRAYWKTGADAERDALRGFFEPEVTKWQYTHGTRNPDQISPDTWNLDQFFLDRPGNNEIQLDLFYDYRTNVDRYPTWQALFREHQPPAIITWGKNDVIFPESGAHPYARDLNNLETHILDTGHFALEEDGDLIAALIKDFLRRNVPND